MKYKQQPSFKDHLIQRLQFNKWRKTQKRVPRKLKKKFRRFWDWSRSKQVVREKEARG